MSVTDYKYFINPLSSRRRPAITRELTKLHYLAPPETISLAEGMPNELTFPFEEINIAMKDGTGFSLTGKDLGDALQYIPTQGYPPLVQELKEFQYRIHNPPIWHRSELLITNGSQDGISKALEMSITENEPILVQNPLYSGTSIIINPYKPEIIPVEQDQDGMIPHLLRRALKERKKQCLEDSKKKMPKLLYINPTGANPTGIVMTLERKKAVYRIACQYNLLILEDDPYMFMHFLDHLPPSFQALDTEGRVIRFDSFSKVLSSGLRLGWVSGPAELIKAIELHIQAATLHSSTLSQVITYKLMRMWGFDRLTSHFEKIQLFYKARRDHTIAALEKHLTGLADWNVPHAGMFVWIGIRGVTDVYDMIMERGIKKLVLFVPGHAFMADPTVACNHIRISFSKTDPAKIEEAIIVLAELIKEEQIRLREKLENCT